MDQHAADLDADLPLILEIEQPAGRASLLAGSDFSCFGWVLSAAPVASMQIFVDGVPLGQATLGIPRPDVAASYPFYAANARAGFWFSAKMPPGMAEGPATLRVEVSAGAELHARDVEILVGPAEAPPADDMLMPIRMEIEDATLEESGVLKVTGWAASFQPLGPVEVFLGGNSLGVAVLDVPRPDVAAVLPLYANAALSGFHFEAQAGLVDPELTDITVTAQDTLGRTRAEKHAIRRLHSLRLFCDDVQILEDGSVSGVGWALCQTGIKAISLFIDDEAVGDAELGINRPDVFKSYPNVPGSDAAGFRFDLALDGELAGEHLVKITAFGAGGEERSVLKVVTAQPAPVPAVEPAAKPAGEVVHLFCDDVRLTPDGAVFGVGWAVCQSGVKAVRIFLDGTPVGEAEMGIRRPDVGKSFPSIPSAVQAGFRFNIKLDGEWAGEHDVVITAFGGADETQSVRQTVQVVAGQAGGAAALAPSGGEDEQLKFYLDLPAVENGRATETTRGFTLLSGWAFARTGIAKIDVLVDGILHGNAFTGIRRDDIQATFPGWDALLSGFAMLLPPQTMKPGTHEVRVLIHDNAGNVGEVAFTILAEEAQEGPGPWQLRQKMKQAELDLADRILAATAYSPACTMALFAPGLAEDSLPLLRSTLQSIACQAYANWRIAVVVPAPDSSADPSPGLAALAESALAGLDEVSARITFVALDRSAPLAGLAGADGLLMALRAGDRLGEDALLELVLEANLHRQADFFYSDERRIDPVDGKEKAFFKPDWSPDLLLSANYIGRLWAASGALVARAGLTLGTLFDGGEYDAVLRLTELAGAIHHIPRVLCTRGPGDAGGEEGDKPALERALQRRGIKADIGPGRAAGTWRAKYDVSAHETAGTMVSIIIPSIASRGLIRTAIESIRGQTRWQAYEIIVIDNIRPGADAELRAWKDWMRRNADLVIELDEDFNWSRFNNAGAARARGGFLLFLNDDIEVLDGDWLHGLLEHAQRPGIGVVGPQLLYPDGRVQHAGMFLSGKIGRHAFRLYPSDAPGPFGLALTQRNVISVTGACLLTRRSVFDQVGGFNEVHPIINNDLDYSLRVQRAGHLVVYTPHVTLIHHEMVSRHNLKDVYDSERFDAEWSNLALQGDPYFHPLLSRDYDDYLIEPEPLRAFQVGHPLIAAERVRRILAVKVDHIGDFIAAMPAFRRLKQHFPNAELCVLAARASLSLAQLEPAIDRMIEFNFFHARSGDGRLDVDTEELLQLQETLAPMRFDIALDLRRQPDTRKILQYTGARWLAGFDQDYQHPWLDISKEFEGDIERRFKRSHVTDSLLQLVDVVATACSTDRDIIRRVRPQGAAARQALAELPAVRPIAKALLRRRIVCVHAGAGAENKQWPAASFAGLINLLISQEMVNVIIVGGPDEVEFTAGVLAQVRYPKHVFSVAGKTRLSDLPAVLVACELFVGNDSGPKHIAAALGVPTIGIHSGSVDAGEWGPIGPLTLTLRRDVTCGPCYIAKASDCPRHLACLTGISVGDVFRACRRMLLLRRTSEELGIAEAEAPARRGRARSQAASRRSVKDAAAGHR